MNNFNPCFLIPCYNHGQALPAVIAALRGDYEYPILIVDDGSDQATKKVLEGLLAVSDIITLAKNQGKGGAVIAGIKAARDLGFSHAIQIDADG